MDKVQDNVMTVDPALRSCMITLTDAPWSSPTARAEGMRKLSAAQLGSLGQIDSIEFAQRLAEQTIRQILPPALRQIGLHEAAERCEREGTQDAAYAAFVAAYPADDGYAASNASHYAVHAARHAAAAARYAARNAVVRAALCAALAARWAAAAAANYAAAHDDDAANAARDGVLTLMCDICIDVLREMKAPGIALMDQVC